MKSKNKKNTVWIVFTCIFALTTVVLAMALYRSHSTLEAVRVQLAEGQTNTITAEMIIPELSEPPVRTLGATIPENESRLFR